MKFLTGQATFFLLANIGLATAALSEEKDSTPRLRGGSASKQQVEKELLELDKMEDMGLDESRKVDESKRELYNGYPGFGLLTESNSVDEVVIQWTVPQWDPQEYWIEFISSNQRIYDHKGQKSTVAYKRQIYFGGELYNTGKVTFNRNVMKRDPVYRFQDGTYYFRIVNKNGAIVRYTNQPSEAVKFGQSPGFDIAIPAMDNTKFRGWFNVSWTIPSAFDTSGNVYLEVVKAGNFLWDKNAKVEAGDQLCGGFNSLLQSWDVCYRDSPREFDKTWGNLGSGVYRVRLASTNTAGGSKVIYAASPQTFRVKAGCVSEVCTYHGTFNGKDCRDCACGLDYWNSNNYCNSVGIFPY